MQAGQAEARVELVGVVLDVIEIVLEPRFVDALVDRLHRRPRIARQTLAGQQQHPARRVLSVQASLVVWNEKRTIPFTSISASAREYTVPFGLK